jgi:flavin-dependent dehydrogenase
MIYDVAIIGSGPAGGLLALLLLKHECNIVIFDNRIPWEKPCGGTLNPRTFDDISELSDYQYHLKEILHIKSLGPSNHVTNVDLSSPWPVLNRSDLGRYFIDKIAECGNKYISDEVMNIDFLDNRWRIAVKSSDKSTKVYFSKIIAGCDGANSKVRYKIFGNFRKEDLALACGHSIKNHNFGFQTDEECTIGVNNYIGYEWIINRPDFISLGLMEQLPWAKYDGMFSRLNKYLNNQDSNFEIIDSYKTIIPSASDVSFYNNKRAGDNWMLLGDAAGFNDPVTGEGIYFALKSAKLASESIISGEINRYDDDWRDDFGGELYEKTLIKENVISLYNNMGPEYAGAWLYTYIINSIS